jgi:hypothetical protein
MEKDGLSTAYREDGTKIKEFLYEKGKLVSSKCFDLKGKHEVKCESIATE